MNKRTFLKILTGTIATTILPTVALAKFHELDNVQAVKEILYNLVNVGTRFEINDAALRKKIYDDTNFYLTETALVHDHSIVCDETVNTVNVIDRNEFRMDLALQFKESGAFIYFPIIIKNTGQSFLSLI